MKRSAIKTDLFDGDKRRAKLDKLGDPLLLETHIDFAALAAEVDRVAPRPVSMQGGRPPFPIEAMVQILVVKRLHNLSDEQVEFQLLHRLSFQRFCGLSQSASIPDRTTVWTFENRIGARAAQAIFDGVQQQLVAHGYLARCGQIVDATIVPAPRQHFTREEKALVEQDAMPVDRTPAQRRQKDLEASWTKKHGKSHHGSKLTVNVDVKHKFIRKIETGTASEHDSRHFEAVLDKANTNADVYTDKAYPSAEREAILKAQGYRNQMQRKGVRNRPLNRRSISSSEQWPFYAFGEPVTRCAWAIFLTFLMCGTMATTMSVDHE